MTAGPDAGDVSASLDVYAADDSCALRGRWTMAAPWQHIRAGMATFTNRDAPGGPTTVRTAHIEAGREARILTRGLGDGRVLDLASGAPRGPGGILAVLTIRNTADGVVRRMCTRFATSAGSEISFRESKRGRRLVARRGVPAACPPTAVATTPADPAQCDVLNAASCLLPYPSSRFLVPAATATGVAVRIPQVGLPAVNGTPVPAGLFDVLDGFSPAVQVLTNFPQGVDVVRSNASRLLPAGCCGQPDGPPWIETRTHTARSLDPDSPTVLLDADTGERLLHWVETDARTADPTRQILFLRPGRILEYGHRYIVAVRNLVTPTCEPVLPEAAFAAIRDGDPAGPAVEARRAALDVGVLDVLAAHGIPRDDLVLAFDFRVGSEDANTKVMRSMRDQAYDWLDIVEADPAAMPFTVETVSENDCSAPGAVAWKNVAGRFDVPLFLEGDLDDATAPFPALDADGLPVQNGFHRARFFATLPCSLLRGTPPSAVLFGHGIFQEGKFFTDLVPAVVNQVTPWTSVAMATDWRGLSSLDVAWVPTRVIGTSLSQLHNFPAFPGRLRQGLLNTLVLARMMKRGLFNRHAAFRAPDGAGVLPGAAEPLGYYGVSLGGIMGTYLAALTPDIERFGLAVGAVNFSCMLQRATPFRPFDALLSAIGITDPLDAALGIQLTHELWVQGEPASVVRRITSNPLPGSGPPKQVPLHRGLARPSGVEPVHRDRRADHGTRDARRLGAAAGGGHPRRDGPAGFGTGLLRPRRARSVRPPARGGHPAAHEPDRDRPVRSPSAPARRARRYPPADGLPRRRADPELLRRALRRRHARRADRARRLQPGPVIRHLSGARSAAARRPPG